MKVLFMTGYADVASSGDEIIMKPFTPRALAARLQGLLQSSLLHAETLTEP
jgi:DNA-binding response OmpR family regulator